MFSAHIYDVPQQARKALDEIRTLRKQRDQTLEELAAAQAAALLAEISETNGRKLVVRTLADRDLAFVKLLAQKLTRLSTNAVALLATSSPQPALAFAQSAGQPFDMGAAAERDDGETGWSRRRKQGHGARWSSERRRNRRCAQMHRRKTWQLRREDGGKEEKSGLKDNRSLKSHVSQKGRENAGRHPKRFGTTSKIAAAHVSKTPNVGRLISCR